MSKAASVPPRWDAHRADGACKSPAPLAALDDNAFALGSVFVTHAAVALAGVQHDENTHEALATRDVIGQAKGILMAQQGITAEDASRFAARSQRAE